MSDQIPGETFNRPPRIQRVQLQGQIDIPAPPNRMDDTARSLLLAMLPVAGILVMGLFYLFIALGSDQGQTRSVLFAIPMLAMGVVSILTGALVYSYQKQEQRQRRIKTIRDYHRMLDRRAARLQAARDLQRYTNDLNFPHPDELLPWVEQPALSLWHRRPEDPDFAVLRLGTGEIRSGVVIETPDPDLEAEGIRRAMDIAFKYRMLPDTSIVLNLREANAIGVVGKRDETLPFIYALLTQLAILHSPNDVNIYVFASPLEERNWNWIRWLPHNSSSHMGGFPDFTAYKDDHKLNLLAKLAHRLETRQVAAKDKHQMITDDHSLIVVIFDDFSTLRTEPAFENILKNRGAAVVAICPALSVADVPEDCNSLIRIGKEQRFSLALTGPSGITTRGSADTVSRLQIDQTARKLANLRLLNVGASSYIPTQVDFLQLYSVRSIGEFNIQAKWQHVPREKSDKEPAETLPFPVPVGNESFSTQWWFNLADNVHGPHGIVAGTTGSGKSELLQTIIAALALEHHPYLINFLLIDFKAGSTFSVFKSLPHTVGFVTELNDAEALRTLEAIKSEQRRRKQFLLDKGFEDIVEYHKQLSRAGRITGRWEPLPHLCIIIDEFAELATSLPNFLPELVSTVRVGRTLGMHLILATQRPGSHVNDEMRANLQFRICLRVQSPDDSRDLLLRPDAAYLPHNIPGRAYFQVGNTGTPHQFQVARVGIEYTPDLEESADKPIVVNLVRQEETFSLYEKKKRDTRSETEKVPLLAEKLVERMAHVFQSGNLPAPEQILLESLSPEIALNHVLKAQDYGGWDGREWQKAGADRRWACAPMGLIDDLANRTQPPLLADLHRQGGHMLVVGGPGTGKTVLLRTLTMSFAQLFRPDEIEIYILSFAGRSLDALEDLPHVGKVIHNDETERVVRMIRYLQDELDKRRRAFAEVSADELETYNRVLSERKTVYVQKRLKPFPAIVNLIDNFVELQQSFAEELSDVISLIRDGRAYGIHFVLTVSEPAKIPYQILNLIEQRLVLRLMEKSDYTVLVGSTGDRAIDPRPGSGLLRANPPLHCQIALPTSGSNDADRVRNLQATIQAMKQTWQGKPAAKPILILPESVPLDGPDGLWVDMLDVSSPTKRSAAMAGHSYEPIITPIGRDGLTLAPKYLNWSAEGPHFLINGPVGSGKSNLLRTMLLGAANLYPPEALQLLLIDFSRESLRPLRRLPHVLGYVADENSLVENLLHFEAELTERRAKVDELRQQNDDLDDSQALMAQCFVPIVIAIDDYDQMRDAITKHQSMLDELGRLIRQDSALNFHLLVAGETANLQRADLLLKQLKLTRSGFALVSTDAVLLLGGRVTTAMAREQLPDGRGYHITRNTMRLMQMAQTVEVADMVRTIRQRWQDCSPNVWQHRANPEQIATINSAINNVPGGPSNTPVAEFDVGVDMAGMIIDYCQQQGHCQQPEVCQQQGFCKRRGSL